VADNENTVTIVGRIGQEPQLRATAKGDVLNMRVATNARRRAADGTWVDGATSWFAVEAWGRLALNAAASLHRGQRVVVHGVLRVDEFEPETGGRSAKPVVKATALGHELTWGTSAFTEQPRAARGEQREPERQDEALQQVPARESAMQAAAPAADWSSSLGADDTPF